MITDAIIAEGLRLDAIERANIRGRVVYSDNPFLQHALTHYADVLREVVRLRPRWTDTPPTVPGWYWWQNADNSPRMYKVWRHRGTGKLVISSADYYQHVDDFGGQWSGPIPEPEGTNTNPFNNFPPGEVQ